MTTTGSEREKLLAKQVSELTDKNSTTEKKLAEALKDASKQREKAEEVGVEVREAEEEVSP